MELQNLILVMDVAKNLEGLRRDMRANAEEYKSRLANGTSAADVKELILANNAQYQRRLGWIKDLYDNNNALFTTALVSMGITMAHTIANYQELKDVADMTDTVSLANEAKIITASDWVLANVTAHLTVW